MDVATVYCDGSYTVMEQYTAMEVISIRCHNDLTLATNDRTTLSPVHDNDPQLHRAQRFLSSLDHNLYGWRLSAIFSWNQIIMPLPFSPNMHTLSSHVLSGTVTRINAFKIKQTFLMIHNVCDIYSPSDRNIPWGYISSVQEARTLLSA